MYWYKRDPNAALMGMAVLTMEECGAYNRLLDILYACDGDVVDDDRAIAKMMHCQPRTWRRLKKRLISHGKVWSESGKIMAKRVENELRTAAELSVNQSYRASKKWEKIRNANQINGSAMPAGNASTSTSTTTSTLKREIGGGKKKKRPTQTEMDEFMKKFREDLDAEEKSGHHG